MNGFIRALILTAMIANLTSCMSRSVDDDLSLDIEDSAEMAFEGTDEGEFAEESGTDEFGDAQASSADAGASDEFSDEFSDSADTQQTAQAGDEFDESFAEPTPADDGFADDSLDAEAGSTVADNAGSGAALEDEFAEFEEGVEDQPVAEAPAPAAPADEFADDFADDFADQDATEMAEAPMPELVIEGDEGAEMAEAPTQEESFEISDNADFADDEVDQMARGGGGSKITDLKFQANDAGGTVIVQGDGPLMYRTRINSDANQFVVEIENATLPDRLKRSLNTKDIQGSIGAVDAYQNPGSNVARFVIQMRDGVGTPVVQQEGNNLLIIANSDSTGFAASAPSSSDTVASTATGLQEGEMSVDGESFATNEKILPSQNLEEFLSGNTKFYGKKISVETNNMDIRDALTLITEESGVNMIVSDEIRGNVNLKLRQVPWDQALVVLMRAKRLGYTRQGNVLRIAPLAELKVEEEDATKMAMVKKAMEPTVVRMFPVSYAKVDELDKKIKDFLTERGKVVGDVRTNSIVVTDTQENVDRISKLIASLDTQPPQVSIEGKIVEANETFTRNIGVNWNASGSPIKMGTSVRGPVNMTPSLSINRALGGVDNAFNLGLTVGTLDIFGTLTAALALNEQTENVKVISAPRITTLSNEQAGITQVTEVPVKQVTQNGTSIQTTYTFKPLTLKLDVTPQVTSDGSVIMKVIVNRQFQGADISTDGSGQFSVNSREANTRVLVKNGQTAVIGGIYQSDATESETGVPWFKEIPLVKYLFRGTNDRKYKSELMIFLTPRIQGDIPGSQNSKLDSSSL